MLLRGELADESTFSKQSEPSSSEPCNGGSRNDAALHSSVGDLVGTCAGTAVGDTRGILEGTCRSVFFASRVSWISFERTSRFVIADLYLTDPSKKKSMVLDATRSVL